MPSQNPGDSAETPREPRMLTEDEAASAIEAWLPSEDGEQQTSTATSTPESTDAATGTNDEPAGTPADESQSPDEATDTEQSEKPQTYRTKVDGEEIEVTLEEALKGYSRQQDYTRKTMALSAKEKEIVAQETAARAERQQVAEKLTELEQAITTLTQEPDWDALRAQDPAVFAETHAAWGVHSKRLEALRAEKEKAIAAVQADFAKQRQETIQREHDRMLEAIPAWKDPEVMKREHTALVTYGKENGFTEQELAEVGDHRAIVLLNKAMLWDRAQKAKAATAKIVKEKIEKVAVAAPGNSRGKVNSATADYRAARKRLSESGSTDDAALAIEKLFG